MARARNIKPGFFTNDDLVELPFEARLLFIGLWTIADKKGRLCDRPKKIKMEIFPADQVDCEKLLLLLQARGFIRRYQVQGGRYIQVTNWHKHQNPHVKEADSTIPEEPVLAPEIPAQPPEEPERAGLIPDSLNLIPDSLKQPCAPAGARVRFEKFWLAYPKKKSKGDAEKAWKAIKPNEQLHDRILHALERAKTSAEWRNDGGKFIPYPATWLRAKGWEDEDTSPTAIKPPPILCVECSEPYRARIEGQPYCLTHYDRRMTARQIA